MKKIFPLLLVLILAFETLSQEQNINKEIPQQNNNQQNQHQQQNNDTQQNNNVQQNDNSQQNQQKNNNSENQNKQNNNPQQVQQNNNNSQNQNQHNDNSKQNQQNNNVQKQPTQNNNNNEQNQQQQQNKNSNTNEKPNNAETQQTQQNQKQNINNINENKNLNNTNLNNGNLNDTNNIKNKTDETKEKIFNLTESLIKFFKETFGKNDTDKDKNKTNNENGKEEIDYEEIKRREKEEIQRLTRERDKIRREKMEALRKAELIKIENQKKEEKRKKDQIERAKFDSFLSNTTFEEVIQISLAKGETETLYLDLKDFVKIKMAVLLTDVEEKVTFFFSGPNSLGRTAVIYKVYDKNYLFYEYETMRKGEYTIDITNRGSKENELFFFVKEHNEIKKDNIDTQKIDRISMFLNDIDSNINSLRNKKKMEIRQINSHNEKVDKNNRSIVIYSIIEIITMFIVFIVQSYYISSIVEKL